MRSLLLGNGSYTQIDVSDDFSLFGKWLVAGLYFAVMMILAWGGSPTYKALVSLSGAMLMVILRSLMSTQFGSGPTLDVHSGVVVEVLLVLFGNLLIANCLKSYVSRTVMDRVISSPFRIMLSAMAVTICIGDYSAMLLLSSATTGNDIFKVALLSGTVLGATLSLMGSLSNVVAITTAYDDVTFMTFTTDKFLPFVVAFALFCVPFNPFVPSILCPGTNAVAADGDTDVATIMTSESTAAYSEANTEDDEEIDEEFNEEYAITQRECDEHFEIEGTLNQPDADECGSTIAVLSLVLILLCYLIGFNEITVCLTAAALWLALSLWRNRASSAGGDENSTNPLQNVDFALIMNVAGQLLLTHSFSDTGIPQTLIATSWYTDVYASCAEQTAEGPCVYWLAFQICIFSLLFSSMNANFLIAATFPYASPYDWMVITLVSSLIGGLVWTPFEKPRLSNCGNYWKFLVPSSLLSIGVGVFTLSRSHISFECSVKLGECSS
jgi:hypothetical protein